MADLLFPDNTPEGSAATFGTPAAPPANATTPASPDAGKEPDKKKGGKKGGIGGFLTSPLGEILGPVVAGGLTALTGGLAAPLLGVEAGVGAAAGGALGAGLEQGIVNKSPVSGLLGAVEGAGIGFGGAELAAAAGPALGLTATGAAAPAAAAGGSAAGGAAPAAAGASAPALTSAGATDPLAGLLGAGGALGPAGPAGAMADAGSPALTGAPALFGDASTPAAAAGGAAGGGAAPAAANTGALSELLAGNYGAAAGDVGSYLAGHPNLALSAVGPLASLLSPTPSVPGIDKLGKSAKDLQRFGSTAITAEQTGNLPPGAEQFVLNAQKDEEARIRGEYASLGLSGSTMEAQDLAAASERADAQRFQIASQVTSQGITALGGASSDFANLAQLQLAQDQRLQEAISSFSSALGYGQGLTRIPTA